MVWPNVQITVLRQAQQEDIRVGLKVRLRKDSQFWGQSGDTAGVVESMSSSGLSVNILWGNGKQNVYGPNDLDLV